MYFNLKSHCYFVQGKNNGAIYNLAAGEVIRLDPSESGVIRRAEEGEETSRAEFLDTLAEMGWGFWAEKKFFIDKLRPYSNYLLMRPDLRSPALGLVFLQLTSQCRHTYAECRQMFCTPCRQSQEAEKPLPVEAWKQIIEELCLAGANHLILTGGNVLLYDGLAELMTFLRQKQLTFSVVVNQSEGLREKIPADVPLIAYICSAEGADILAASLAGYADVTLLFHEHITARDRELFHQPGFKRREVAAYNLKINKKKLKPCYMQDFFSRKDFNDCLNGKMYIESQGRIVPCFQKNDTCIGNLLTEDFPQVYRKLVRDYWNKPVSHAKCALCELYYSCMACAFMNPNDLCGYDVENGVWGGFDVGGNPFL